MDRSAKKKTSRRSSRGRRGERGEVSEGGVAVSIESGPSIFVISWRGAEIVKDFSQ